MRPPEFTGGNIEVGARIEAQHHSGFNEAAGIHRRKRLNWKYPSVSTVSELQ